MLKHCLLCVCVCVCVCAGKEGDIGGGRSGKWSMDVHVVRGLCLLDRPVEKDLREGCIFPQLWQQWCGLLVLLHVHMGEK